MLKLIFYIVVAVLLLSFFGVSIQHLVESPTTQSNFSFVWDLAMQGWDDLVAFITNIADTFFKTIF